MAEMALWLIWAWPPHLSYVSILPDITQKLKRDIDWLKHWHLGPYSSGHHRRSHWPVANTADCRCKGGDVQGRRHLRSAARGLLHTLRYYLSPYRRRAFSYAGPSAWNSLPEHLRASDLSLNSFRHSLRDIFVHTDDTCSAVETF